MVSVEAAVPSVALYPPSPAPLLRDLFVGKDLQDIEAPTVVLDAAVIRRNCKNMLDTVAALDLSFRAHIKTHKVGLTPVTYISLLRKLSRTARVIFSTKADQDF